MIRHFCDKCGAEIAEAHTVMDKELCDVCIDRVDAWIDGKYELDFPMEHNCVNTEWHDMRMGYPNERGIYLVTVEFNGQDGISHMVRFAKYTGAPCWYKIGMDAVGTVEDTGGRVTAWAHSPDPYFNRMDG